MFEKLLYKQINEYLLYNSLLSKTQFGFSTSYSTMDAILYRTEFFRKTMDENNNIAVSFLGLSKAFDAMNHDHLKNKLHDLGFSESAIERIHSFINKRQQKTVVDKTESNWMSLHQGVPQGTILGPLIFNLYIKDLNKNLTESCKVVQYVDDTLLVCDDNDINNALQLLQKSCQKLALNCTKHSLKLNTKKTELIIFSKKHQGRNHNSKFSIILDNKTKKSQKLSICG